MYGKALKLLLLLFLLALQKKKVFLLSFFISFSVSQNSFKHLETRSE